MSKDSAQVPLSLKVCRWNLGESVLITVLLMPHVWLYNCSECELLFLGPLAVFLTHSFLLLSLRPLPNPCQNVSLLTSTPHNHSLLTVFSPSPMWLTQETTPQLWQWGGAAAAAESPGQEVRRGSQSARDGFGFRGTWHSHYLRTFCAHRLRIWVEYFWTSEKSQCVRFASFYF